MKSKYLLIVTSLLIAMLINACGQQNQEVDPAVIVALTQTAAAPAASPTPAATVAPTETAVTISTGAINGRVHLIAPPTPAMVVYAVDQATNQWVSTETAATDGEASFTLEVPAGSYVVYAFSADPATGAYAGYPSQTEPDLGIVNVAAGQTITDIIVRPPDQAECGSLWGVPPSPDGRFPSYSPSDACIVTQAADEPYSPVSPDVCQTLQDIANQALVTSFTAQESAPFVDNITGSTGLGCTLTASGTGVQFSEPGQVIDTLVNAYQGWNELPEYQADGPTGSAAAMTRDMALMLILAEWQPAPEANCPTDQPITNCNLTPEQKIYTIQVQVAQK